MVNWNENRWFMNFLSTKIRKAQTCCRCHETIPAGTECHAKKMMSAGRFYSIYCCPACAPTPSHAETDLIHILGRIEENNGRS